MSDLYRQLTSDENIKYLETKVNKAYFEIYKDLTKENIKKIIIKSNYVDIWDGVKKLNKMYIDSNVIRTAPVLSNKLLVDEKINTNWAYNKFIAESLRGGISPKVSWYNESDEAWEEGKDISAEERISEYNKKHGFVANVKPAFKYDTRRHIFNANLSSIYGDNPSYETPNRSFNIKPRTKYN